MVNERRRLFWGLILVVAVTTIGLLFALQGWKSRVPAFDMLTYFNSADTLLARGIPARYGDVSSYGSFSPPGTTWLLAPGMLLFNDPRLYEKFSSGMLHLGTLLGVLLVARQCLAPATAYLAVALYGLSTLGLSFAGSLWPIGHPFFYVWLTYFAVRWIADRNAKHLAAAMAVWTVGMYVDMAITPAVLMLPVLWLLYRPPLFSRVHLITAALTVLVWYPYIHFEWQRGFADLGSQFFLHDIAPANYKQAWCDSGLTLRNVAEAPHAPEKVQTPRPTSTPVAAVLNALVGQARRTFAGFRASFVEVTASPRLSLLLTLVALASVGGLAAAPLLPHARALLTRYSSLVGDSRSPGAHSSSKTWLTLETQVFLLALMVPWIALVVVAEPGRTERFFWLWPLQAIALAAFVTDFMRRWHVNSFVLWLSAAVLITIVASGPVQTHVGRWMKDGWSGSDPEEVHVVDYIATQLVADGRRDAAIGYQLFIYDFMPKYHVIDPQYKVGAEFDILLRYRHGIRNTDQCAEGLSPIDEYRIVQTRPRSGDGEPRAYFDGRLDEQYRPVRRFDLYQVFRRD